MSEMQSYVGVKVINAKPMTRLDYNVFRGWKLPVDENGADEGFLVEYVDGGKANTTEFAGYVSWSPKDVFERACRPVAGMTFGAAVEALKTGYRVARAGWNGKGMFLIYVATNTELRVGQKPYYDVRSTDAGVPSSETHRLLPWIGMKTADGCLVPWLASQTDVLAEDWMVTV